MKDTYNTIASPSPEILYKEKNSKFFGYAFPVSTEAEIKIHLDQLRKQHHGAVHFCYAFQLGTETITFRANDDGEPSNSAGMPIYGQIQSFEVTNVLVVVVRFLLHQGQSLRRSPRLKQRTPHGGPPAAAPAGP